MALKSPDILVVKLNFKFLKGPTVKYGQLNWPIRMRVVSDRMLKNACGDVRYEPLPSDVNIFVLIFKYL